MEKKKRYMYYVDFLSYLEQIVLFLACQSPSENGSKLKEFATKGSKFFPFRVNHFQEEAKPIFYRVVSLESVPLPWRCRCLITFEACQVKTCLLTCTFSNPAAHMQSIIWSFSPFIHSVVSNNSFNGQRRPWSDCADAQADRGLRCPHMPEDTFSHDAADIYFKSPIIFQP